MFLKALKHIYRRNLKLLPPPKDPFVFPDSAPLNVYRCYDKTIEILDPIDHKATITKSSELLQEPGYIEFENKIYDLTKDGVYRFYRLPNISTQYLVCKNGVNSLLKMAGYLWIYGKKDDKLTIEQAYDSIHHKIIYASCGQLSRLMQHICTRLHIESRIVACMSKNIWNGQDDGHTLLEIKNRGKWFAYDPGSNLTFYLENEPISIFALSKNKDLPIELHFYAGNTSVGEFNFKNYDYGFWVNERFLSTSCLWRWYQKVLDVPLIEIGVNYIFPENFVTEKDHSRFLHRYTPLSERKFIDTYYSS